MIQSHTKSHQQARTAWSRDCLLREHAITLGEAIDTSTLKNYSSALNSYLSFIKLHDFPMDPTPDTISSFTVFMSHHIEPRSVSTYLSGICQQLKPYFPNVRPAHHSPLVERTMKGCLQLHRKAVTHKRTLKISDLFIVLHTLARSTLHDDLLFIAMILTGFFALLHLGELTFPNSVKLQNWRKITKRSTVVCLKTSMNSGFHLTKQTLSLKGTTSL